MSYWENVFAMIGAACFAGYVLSVDHDIMALVTGCLAIFFGYKVNEREK